jgi:2-C-methyl-D-erythritol 4-phosphate cytidylyltransferase
MSATDTQPPATSAVIVAAGSSTRMGAAHGARKPLLPLAGRTVIEHACAAFDALPCVREIVVVAHADDVGRLRELSAASPALRKLRAVVPGGEQRPDSVRAGLAACDPASALVAVHDAARPLVTPDIVERALRAAARHGAALVAVPVADTLKAAPDGERAASTVDRSALWCAQTPQVFRLELLRALAERAAAEGFRPTDESALHERYVGPVALVRGSAENLKITTPEDLRLAAAILRGREERA